MAIDRRRFLSGTGVGAGAALGLPIGGVADAAAAPVGPPAARNAPPSADQAPLLDWAAVRAEFPLSRDHIHLALMLVTSHPRPVRDAIERHRRALDVNP